jgi:hypothetical protein
MLTFHKDLARGKQIEEMVLSIIHKKYPRAYIVDGYFKDWDIYVPEVQKSVEVKSDEKSKYTGNIVIEVEFNGKPSALSTTKADYWVIHDGYEFHWMLPDMIRKCIEENNLRLYSFTAKGDTNEKKAYLIKKEILYSYEQSKFTPKVSATI